MEPSTFLKCGNEDEIMEVETFYEDPHVVSQDDVVKQGEHQLTLPGLWVKEVQLHKLLMKEGIDA